MNKGLRALKDTSLTWQPYRGTVTMIFAGEIATTNFCQISFRANLEKAFQWHEFNCATTILFQKWPGKKDAVGNKRRSLADSQNRGENKSTNWVASIAKIGWNKKTYAGKLFINEQLYFCGTRKHFFRTDICCGGCFWQHSSNNKWSIQELYNVVFIL